MSTKAGRGLNQRVIRFTTVERDQREVQRGVVAGRLEASDFKSPTNTNFKFKTKSRCESWIKSVLQDHAIALFGHGMWTQEEPIKIFSVFNIKVWET